VIHIGAIAGVSAATVAVVAAAVAAAAPEQQLQSRTANGNGRCLT